MRSEITWPARLHSGTKPHSVWRRPISRHILSPTSYPIPPAAAGTYQRFPLDFGRRGAVSAVFDRLTISTVRSPGEPPLAALVRHPETRNFVPTGIWDH